MLQVSSFRSRQLTAISLTCIHSTASALTLAVLFWSFDSSVVAAPLTGQAAPFNSVSLDPEKISSPPKPTAKQRSQYQGQLPTLPPTPPLGGSGSEPPLINPAPNLEAEPLPIDKWNRYRLGPGDGIYVNVQRFPDLTFQAVINPEGNIVVPLIGSVSVEGLTLQEAQEQIRRSLDQYIVDPVVTLSLLSQRPVQVTVIGEVAKPGFYPLNLPRVSAALLLAGGATTAADLRAVQVRRTLADGSVIEQSMDLFTALKNGGNLPDLRLEDGDAIFIPKLVAGADQEYDRTLIARSTLAKPLISIRVLSYAAGGIGTLNLPSGSTFVDALNGIPLDSANLRKIALVRFDPEQGKAVTRTLDGKGALTGDTSQNVPLQDNDVIVVGRNLVARITYALNTFTQPFRDTLGFLLFFREINNSASDLFGPTRR